eukprot:766659-Hanusia_phi.AAC.2
MESSLSAWMQPGLPPTSLLPVARALARSYTLRVHAARWRREGRHNDLRISCPSPPPWVTFPCCRTPPPDKPTALSQRTRRLVLPVSRLLVVCQIVPSAAAQSHTPGQELIVLTAYRRVLGKVWVVSPVVRPLLEPLHVLVTACCALTTETSKGQPLSPR